MTHLPFCSVQNGMYPADDYTDPNALPTWLDVPYVTAMLKGQHCEFCLKGGDASRGDGLKVLYDGVRPQHNLYSPMKLQGNIILGTGGDNSHRGSGTFFEGAMVRGYAPDEADEAVHANIAAAGYRKAAGR